MSKEVKALDVNSLFSDDPKVAAVIGESRPKVESTMSVDAEGNITIVIPNIDASFVTASKTGKPMVAIAIPELTVTLRRADGKTAKRTAVVPYGALTLMIRG